MPTTCDFSPGCGKPVPTSKIGVFNGKSSEESKQLISDDNYGDMLKKSESTGIRNKRMFGVLNRVVSLRIPKLTKVANKWWRLRSCLETYSLRNRENR